MRLSAAGLAGSAAHPASSGSATDTPAQSAVHQQYSSFCWNIRDQRMIAKAKDSHPENGESKSACVGLARAGLVVRSIPRWCLPSRFRVRAGPRSGHRTLSDFQSAECGNSPAHLTGRCGVSLLRWVWRRPLAGLRPGRRRPPSGSPHAISQIACRASSLIDFDRSVAQNIQLFTMHPKPKCWASTVVLSNHITLYYPYNR